MRPKLLDQRSRGGEADARPGFGKLSTTASRKFPNLTICCGRCASLGMSVCQQLVLALRGWASTHNRQWHGLCKPDLGLLTVPRYGCLRVHGQQSGCRHPQSQAWMTCIHTISLASHGQAREWYREDLVSAALKDTLRGGRIERRQLFITSKLHPRHHGYTSALAQLEKVGIDHEIIVVMVLRKLAYVAGGEAPFCRRCAVIGGAWNRLSRFDVAPLPR